MTDEEIKAYVSVIEKTSVDELSDVLSSILTYNVDIVMSKICDALAENVKLMRKLNKESATDEFSDEIIEVLKKLYICIHYLDDHVEMSRADSSLKSYRLVFLKTPAGHPYFDIDMNKVPKERQAEVFTLLNTILHGIDIKDGTKVRFFPSNVYGRAITEFKGFQIRIYTVKLKANILCVLGLTIKKDDWKIRLSDWLRTRLSSVYGQIERLKAEVNSSNKEELLAEGDVYLEGIMSKLSKGVSEEVEMLFPDEEELQALVPEEVLETEDILESGNVETLEDSSLEVPVPSAAKKVKRRTRGRGKKTLAREEIMKLIKDMNLDELARVRIFIDKVLEDRKLTEQIGSIYEGFLSMSDDQVSEFDESLSSLKK